MASGRINGACTGSSKSKYNFWAEWSSTPDAKTNTSLLTVTSYLQRNDGYKDSAWNREISPKDKFIRITGTLVFPSTTKGIDTRNNAKVKIAEAKNVRIYHDKDGYATANVLSIFPKVSDSLTGGKLDKNISLDHIDQKPPKITSLKFTPTQTTIKTEWTADVPIDKVWYAYGYGFQEYDGKVIPNLTPNVKYWVAIKVQKKGTNLTATSETQIIKTLPIYITSIGLQGATVDVGTPVDLQTDIQPSNASIKSLEWTSSNPKICKVENGKVTALESGIVQITAKAKDGSGKQETVTVICEKRVSGLVVSERQIDVPRGSSAVINYTVLPADASDKSVTITSDSDIISIAGNTVTGIENGTATVTIKTNDGGFEKQITINVLGDFVWYDYSRYIEILNYWDILNLFSNMKVIYALLLKKGVDVKPLKEISVTYDTEFAKMFEILSDMEYNLDRLNETSYQSEYYKEPHIVGEFGEDKAEIFRWIQILNDMYMKLNEVTA